MLTIGELAAFVGVSTRTVRFYHSRGLLPEPPRDEAGYRRYSAEDVVRLSRIVALASAGVPLVRVGELLEVGEAEFAAGVAEVDAGLQAETRRLRALRSTLANLDSPDRLALPEILGRAIEKMRSAGAPTAYVDLYRDAWILAYALYQDEILAYLQEYDLWSDPVYLDMQVRMLQLAEVDPLDPRVDALAEDTVAWMEQNRDVGSLKGYEELFSDERANRILTAQWIMTPSWDRLSLLVMERAQERGLAPVTPPEESSTPG